MIEVSIVIVSYNNLDILANCINSLVKFTKDINYRIFIVDNGTTSDSIKEFADKYNDIVLIENKKNIGFAAANNKALKIVDSPYILFLNNDTVFLENSIAKVLRFAKDKNEEMILGCELLNSDYTHQNSIVDFYNVSNLFGEAFFLYKLFPRSSFFNKYNKNFKNIDKPINVDFVAGAFLFSSTELIKKLNGFDERFFFYGEEADLCYRAKEINVEAVYFPETTIIHLMGATAMKNLWFKFKNQSVAKIQFFQKHYNGISFFACLTIFYIGTILRIPIYFLAGVLTLNKELTLKSYLYFKSLFVFPQNQYK